MCFNCLTLEMNCVTIQMNRTYDWNGSTVLYTVSLENCSPSSMLYSWMRTAWLYGSMQKDTPMMGHVRYLTFFEGYQASRSSWPFCHCAFFSSSR